MHLSSLVQHLHIHLVLDVLVNNIYACKIVRRVTGIGLRDTCARLVPGIASSAATFQKLLVLRQVSQNKVVVLFYILSHLLFVKTNPFAPFFLNLIGHFH